MGRFKFRAVVLVGLLIAAAAPVVAQEAEPISAQQCIGYMEKALKDAYLVSDGFNPSTTEWRGIYEDAVRCGAWHSAHGADEEKRALFAKAYATFKDGIAAPSMAVLAKFGGESMAYTTAP